MLSFITCFHYILKEYAQFRRTRGVHQQHSARSSRHLPPAEDWPAAPHRRHDVRGERSQLNIALSLVILKSFCLKYFLTGAGPANHCADQFFPVCQNFSRVFTIEEVPVLSPYLGPGLAYHDYLTTQLFLFC